MSGADPPDNITLFPGTTRLDIPPQRVLDAAADTCEACVVVGWDADGALYLASSIASDADVIYLLEAARHKLLCMADH